MELHSSHPLDNITRNNPYSMLEALIPFVDYPMKLPLALMVKYQEMRLILNAFRSVDSLSQYGLHNTSSDPMEMLGNIMGISPEMLRTLTSLMETQNINFSEAMGNFNTDEFQSRKDYVNQNNTGNNYTNQNYTRQNYVNNNDENSSKSYQANNSFDEKIKNIFAEYDLLQAAEYNQENTDEDNNRLHANYFDNGMNDNNIINPTNPQQYEPEYYI